LPAKERRRQIGVHIDMTPMVDVMMLLVIFFMMSTAFVAVYPGFAVNLPQASAGRQHEEQIIVMIARDGQIAIDGQAVKKEEIAPSVRAAGGGVASVSIRADKEVNHGRVVEVMDEIRKAGVTKMAIAIEPKGP
jgi:biopolymer transport protein ExbD